MIDKKITIWVLTIKKLDGKRQYMNAFRVTEALTLSRHYRKQFPGCKVTVNKTLNANIYE